MYIRQLLSIERRLLTWIQKRASRRLSGPALVATSRKFLDYHYK